MPTCAAARCVPLSAPVVLSCWLLGGAVFAVGVAVLPRPAAAQAQPPLSPAEKERLFQQFQDAQGAARQAPETASPDRTVPAHRDTSAFAQPAPVSRPARPRLPFASEPVETPVEPALSVPAAPSVSRARVVVHVPPGAAADALSTRLLASFDPRLETVELRRVAATPSRPSVRYFYAEDEFTARNVAAQMSGTGLAWTVRDFSTFRPLPSRGTIEVWLPQEG